MPILEKIIRVGAIAIAVLFIGLSLFGIFGAWFVDRKARSRGLVLSRPASKQSMPE